MTLPDFLNASYALNAEEHQRIDPFKDLLKIGREVPSAPGRVKPSVAQQNEQGVAAIQGLLSGVQGSPVKKPRRA